ncbi:MAG: chromosome segregation protein SMC [Candidatus Dormibacteraeota bacterium]|nr:chromosome segregation protein SMC [Candidatus Dormibacteraeota bacterium]
MKLRRLSLSGFKTFASRAEVTFDRGVTAIVGPNGSGKSNLVDAVRWALGETNARELRGQRMDEVIYSGGGRRARTNIAEVELIIDNEEGGLPVEDPEVAVTRRVVRGAHDTEYRINGDRARLRDLERLLGSTGLTQNGYAVVAQNDIDSIIEATPPQRRVLVEQAAGVRALRAACEETRARLSHPEAALRRMDDLLADAGPRLAELAAQRGAAMEQREISARLIELRGSLAREEWRSARGRARQAQRRLEQALSKLEAANEADTAFSDRAAAERANLDAARLERDQAVARLEEARLAAERAQGELHRLADRIRTAVVLRRQAQLEGTAAIADLESIEGSLAGTAATEVDWTAVRAADEAAAKATRVAREALAEAARVRGEVAASLGGDGGVARAVASGAIQGRRLSECFEVRRRQDSTAVAAALEGHLGGWVVQDIAGAAARLDPNGPREELLEAGVDPGEPERVPDPWRSALDAVAVNTDARGVVARLLRGTWLASDEAEAKAALGAGALRAVLPDGRVHTTTGIRGGGRPAHPLELIAAERAAQDEARRATDAEASAVAAAHAARLPKPSGDTGGLTASARARVFAAALRLGAAEAETLAALAMSRSVAARRAAAGEAVTKARADLEWSSAPLERLERSVVALESEHAEVAVSLARAEDERVLAQAEVDAAEAEMARLIEAVRGEVEDDSTEWDPQAAERAEREIVRLERRIAQLGAVNALAPEQHDALEARVTALASHRDDIGNACLDLHAMTRRLAADLERRFDAVFGAVSFHFQQMFSELFPGGKATLRLEETPVEDDSDAHVEEVAERRPGVEILAQPPGKRLCPLRLLSGGERALTALATVLALQQVNPSPFYVFDEVDAALDDSNVLRFTRLLRRLAEAQQFIVVTHNHITMAAADVLWGVTIDGDGVSTVLGMRFDAGAHPEAGEAVALRSGASRAAG